MTRIFCIILLIILSFTLCGCYGTDSDKIPRLELVRTINNIDNIYIALRDNHNFNIQHLYEEVETEDGYDIIIHIIKDK